MINIDNIISRDEVLLANAEKLLLTKQRYYNKMQEIEGLIDEYKKYDNQNKELLLLAVEESTSYRSNCKSNLEDAITQNIAVVMPEERFVAKIDYDDSGKSPTATLELYQDGESYIPKAQNGGMIQQLVSISTGMTCNIIVGNDSVKMDETCSNACSERVVKIAPIVEEIANLGLQIEFVEHKPEIYENVFPRREIHLIKDREFKKETRIDKILDITN